MKPMMKIVFHLGTWYFKPLVVREETEDMKAYQLSFLFFTFAKVR